MTRPVALVAFVLAFATPDAPAQTPQRLNERSTATVKAGGVARSVELRWRLLILAEFTDRGAKVVSVNPAGPGAWMYRLDMGQPIRGILEPGDVITAVDGTPIRSQADYYTALNASNRGKIRVAVIDRNTGRELVWDAQAVEVVPPGPDPNPQPPTTKRATGVKILLVADTDDGSIGNFIKVSVGKLQDQFEQIADLAPDKVQVKVLTGAQVNAKTINEEVMALRPGPTEAVLYYHLGHGAYDKTRAMRDPSGGHFFALKGGDLFRKQVWDTLKGKGAQLTAMVTDTCNVGAVPNPAFRYVAPITRSGESRVLANLLLDHAGDIDVSGSSRDQFGWFSPDLGGWWTDGVLFGLTPAAYRGRRDAFVTWEAFVNASGERASKTFLDRKETLLKNPPAGIDQQVLNDFRNQKDQRPQVFVNAVRPVR